MRGDARRGMPEHGWGKRDGFGRPFFFALENMNNYYPVTITIQVQYNDDATTIPTTEDLLASIDVAIQRGLLTPSGGEEVSNYDVTIS